jgi:hypothetical protein
MGFGNARRYIGTIIAEGARIRQWDSRGICEEVPEVCGK